MIDLKQIFENLKVGMKIPTEFAFLQKYDVNKNSIFEQNEIETICDELEKSASIDGDKDDLSENEILDFYNKSFEKSQKANYAFEVSNYVLSWIHKLSGNLPDIMGKLEKDEGYQKLSDSRKECVKILVDNTLRLNALEVEDYPLEFFTTAFPEDEYSEEEIKKLLPILNELNKIPLFDISNNLFAKDYLLNLGDKITPQKIQYVIDSGLYNNYATGLLGFLGFDDEEFEQSKKFLEIKELERKPDNETLSFLIKNPQSYDRLLELCKNYELSSISVRGLGPLLIASDEDFEKAKRLADITYNKDGKTKKIGISDAYHYLFKLNDEQIQKTIELMNMKSGKETGLYIGYASELSKYNTESFNKFIQENPKFAINRWNDISKTVSLKKSSNSNEEYIFNQENGLVETKTTDYDEETSNCEITINNTYSHIKQKVYYENFSCIESSDTQNPTKEVMEYYDKKGKLVKTVTITKGDIAGLPIQTVTYPNGKTETAQFATYDSTDNTMYVEKHLTSPLGVKTDYTFVQTLDGSRILDYKITDKDGKILMERHNTFQEVSKNHFITSTNGHGYDIVIEGKTLKITDSKDRTKTNEIDLTEVIEDNNTGVMMEVLKIVPGQQLLMLKKLPVNKLKYEHDEKYYAWRDNGVWEQTERRITLGKQTRFTISELESLKNMFIHEYGHYLDSNLDSSDHSNVIAEDDEVKKVFEKELGAFVNNSTSMHCWYLKHILDDSISEKTGDANRHLHTAEMEHAMRSLYFMQFFPETIAIIDKKIEQREQEFSV